MISYKEDKNFTGPELMQLFCSLNWESGKYPERLQKSLSNYGFVASAWDEKKLIGLIGAMDDGEMTAYVHYLIIAPQYQNQGIGKALMTMLKEHYKNYLRILLISYPDAVNFYKNCGFTKVEGNEPFEINRM